MEGNKSYLQDLMKKEKKSTNRVDFENLDKIMDLIGEYITLNNRNTTITATSQGFMVSYAER